mmetsp:Transcript_18042/g.24359  ORF Transcript_18042/g.24359 Transcript_18042/m.24359 type:complete len:107 (+) Transcript_18042:34-354(+)
MTHLSCLFRVSRLRSVVRNPHRQISGVLTDDQIEFQQLARSFAEKEMAPHAAQWDRESFFPVPTLRQAAGLGFGGIFVKHESGSQLSRVDGAIIFEVAHTHNQKMR